MDNNKIFLRGFELEDYILINKWRNDPEIQNLLSGNFRYVSSEIEKEWVKQKMMNNTKELYLAICLAEGGCEMIGYTSINNIDYITDFSIDKHSNYESISFDFMREANYFGKDTRNDEETLKSIDIYIKFAYNINARLLRKWVMPKKYDF